MSRKFGEDAYAVTMWAPEDVQSLRPNWTLDECRNWLERNEKYIQDGLVSYGWDVIDGLLPSEDENSI